MSDRASLRAADAERELAIEELREHLVAGRLTPAEFEERTESAYKATTRGDLDVLKRDLPMSPAAVQRSLAQRRRHLRRRLLQETGGSLVVSLVCVAVWFADGADAHFWPAWVILFTLLPALRDGWTLFGPEPDEDKVEARLARRRRRALMREHIDRRLPPSSPGR
jgi:hypothetical protein